MRMARALRLLALAAVVLFALILVTLVVAGLASPVAALVVLAVAAIAFLAWRMTAKRVKRGSVLEIDLDKGVVEKPPASPVERVLFRGAVVLRDVIDALDRAAGDARIEGVVARVGNGGLGLAQAQEIRDAVHRFREAGKRTVAYSETFGETGRATIDYYLATAFEEIHLQPVGSLSIEGMVSRTPFLRSLLDKLGVVPDFDHRRQYKSAMYLLTERGYVEPHEEMARSILEDQMAQIVTGIGADRGLEADRVRELIDAAPLLDQDALSAGLVDRLSYRDEAYGVAGGEDAEFLFHDRYLKRAGRPHRKGKRIALVFGTGAIVRGSSGVDPRSRGSTLGADDVAQALREASDDAKIKAVVFRVDSEGGSAVASEVVRRELVRARAAGKPVVVSMGDVAGSGGYWISTPASKIVAQPGTVTGSIGVVSGKLAARGAWERFGIDWGELHEGRNATFSVALEPYTESERERLGATLDAIYEDFKKRVSEDRKIPSEDVEELARGRVWTGSQALERGLVDELGGLDRAVEIARELAGLDPDAPAKLAVYPVKRAVPFPDRKEGSDPISTMVAVLTGLADTVRRLSSGASGEVRMSRPRR